jgi:hypothetical protein
MRSLESARETADDEQEIEEIDSLNLSLVG